MSILNSTFVLREDYERDQKEFKREIEELLQRMEMIEESVEENKTNLEMGFNWQRGRAIYDNYRN